MDSVLSLFRINEDRKADFHVIVVCDFLLYVLYGEIQPYRLDLI